MKTSGSCAAPGLKVDSFYQGVDAHHGPPQRDHLLLSQHDDFIILKHMKASNYLNAIQASKTLKEKIHEQC